LGLLQEYGVSLAAGEGGEWRRLTGELARISEFFFEAAIAVHGLGSASSVEFSPCRRVQDPVNR